MLYWLIASDRSVLLAVPNIKSAIKRVEVAERNRVRNRAWKTSIRTVQNQVVETVKAGKSEDMAKALQRAYKVIDTAVSKGVMHKNAAARRKSRMALQTLSPVGATK